jgi:chromosome segregation protein
MRLKHLVLQGFKTFATKTEFSFDGDITAIIGPNGSGKSNVADALRWVLGEQSYSQLRARRSEDLIFSGSIGRGQQGMAEVTLTFDNADRSLAIDYDEVSITRRAFRSGENEYFINRSRVRLRDIQELLTPAGHSFSVVGQGLADELLSLRPEDRRVLFEEAAGIRPFYAQRDDALKRLARTEENMVRVSDLVAELEPQLKSLERQARHAQEYNSVAGELHDLLDTWYGRQRQAERAALGEAEAQEQAAATALAAARERAALAERRLQEVRREAAAARAELDRLTGEQAGLLHSQEQASRAAAVHAERLAALEQQQQQTLLEHEAGRDALAQASAQVAEIQAAQQDAEGDEQGLRARVAAAEAALGRAAETRRTTDRALTAAQERAAEASAHAAGLKQRLASSEDHRRELERQLAEQQEAARRLIARQATEQAELDQARTAAAEAEAAQGAAQEALAAAERAVAAAQHTRDAAEKNRRAGAAEVDNLRTRLELARNLSEGGAGLPHAVRAVLGAARGGTQEGGRKNAGPGAQLTGIVGVVASLLEVPREFETAIEVALGGRINDVVVERWPDAEAAIAFLQQAKAGRATFLPLDSLRGGDGAGDPLRLLDSRQGVHGLASRLVATAADYQVVVDQLLGRTLVVEDLPVARRVLGRLPGGWSIVTVGGEIVRSGGAVTGGSAAREHGMLARERERRDLAAALEQAQATQAGRVAAVQQAADALARAEASRLQAGETLAAARRLAGERRGAAGQLAQRLAQTGQEQTWREGLVAQAGAALRDYSTRLQGFTAELARMEQESGPLAVQIAELQAAAQHARQSEVVAREELTALRTQLAVAEEGARHRRAALQAARAQQGRLADQQRARAGRLETLGRELAQAAEGLEQARAEAAGWERAGDELRGRTESARAALDTTRERQATAEQESHAAQSAALTAESAHGHTLVERERRQGAAGQLRTRIEEDLGLAVAPETLLEVVAADAEAGADAIQTVFQPQIPEVDPWTAWTRRWDALAAEAEAAPADPALEGRIGQLRGKLRRMGPINPLAIDEYAAAQTRHGFLTTQLHDLRTAADSLRQVAAELDRLMRERLAETFKAVAAAFQETFPRLFGGGSARLELTDPQDVTATGIEVLAQPPGKRQQPLSALSGGERALTSVALLFAILKVRPTPFCIMDEVDAALDEANIGRFRNELRDLSTRSQFILITHNRATIEAAAAIYGVSLGADTASRVLSLRLEEVPLAPAA